MKDVNSSDIQMSSPVLRGVSGTDRFAVTPLSPILEHVAFGRNLFFSAPPKPQGAGGYTPGSGFV